MFTRAEFRRLNKFDRIYILVSGGKDSTYTALNMYNLKFWIRKPVILLHTNTGNRLKSAVKTLEKLTEHTGWERVDLEAKPYIPKSALNIVIDSLRKLDEAKDLLIEGKYSKKVFPCCYWLKEKPFEKWLRKEDHSNDIFILSIKPGDSSNRQLWLSKLRKKKTKFWLNGRRKAHYYYPLRDCKQEMVDSYFLKIDKFRDTVTSGCPICPILALFDLESEGKRYQRTMKKLREIYAEVSSN